MRGVPIDDVDINTAWTYYVFASELGWNKEEVNQLTLMEMADLSEIVLEIKKRKAEHEQNETGRLR